MYRGIALVDTPGTKNVAAFSIFSIFSRQSDFLQDDS
jgi:hypothetical protein